MARRKKVTDPLDERVKASIFGFSSGSEHNDVVEEDDSPCLSNLLCGFLDQQDPITIQDSKQDEDDSYSQHNYAHLDILNQALGSGNTDQFRNVLVSQVSKAIEIFWFVKSDGSLLRRNVMAFLRSGGYNAGICKTKWETSGRLSAGNYEFIDVVFKSDDDSNTDRYIIDINFANEFEIARQTNEYQQLLLILPRVFIGKCDDLKQIVKIISDAARRSLKSRGLHLPPWRKNRFMQNKWFSPYRRTVNFIPANVSCPAKQMVKCRSVGFNAVNSRPLIR